tara:strand:+ start:63 stop:347 length:285 start_codon:yes stop_codon:yes gene_type:complete
MKITKRQLRRIIKEEKAKIVKEGSRGPGWDQPIFHDAALNAALDDYVGKYVAYLEEDIGESRATLALHETLKEYLVNGIEEAVREAEKAAGVEY